MAIINYNGQQVLSPSDDQMSRIKTGADDYNKATGSSLSAQDYDKMLNPTTYGARWGVSPDGSQQPGSSATGSASGSGVISSSLTATPATAQKIATPTTWSIDPSQTVEGRIASIIGDRNNPLQVQARTAANEEMNARGLVNSSIAEGAAQDAMYHSALPIATADAATAAKAAGYNADQINQANTNNAQMGNQVGIANLNAGTQLETTRIGAQTQKDVAAGNNATTRDVATMNADSQQRIAALDAGTRTTIQGLQNQNQVLLNTSSQAASAFNQALVSTTNIQNNPNLDAQAKTQAIAQTWQSMSAQLSVLAKLNGLDLTSTLNFAGQPGYDAKGNWIGFTATPAPTPTPGIINSGNGV